MKALPCCNQFCNFSVLCDLQIGVSVRNLMFTQTTSMMIFFSIRSRENQVSFRAGDEHLVLLSFPSSSFSVAKHCGIAWDCHERSKRCLICSQTAEKNTFLLQFNSQQLWVCISFYGHMLTFVVLFFKLKIRKL